MRPLLFYLAKAAICLIPFYALYITVLRRLTFFRWNRFYLLASLALSMIIPILPVGYAAPVTPGSLGHTAGGGYAIGIVAENTVAVVNHPVFSLPGWQDWLVLVYLLGTAVTFFFLIRNLWKIYKLINTGNPDHYGDLRVLSADDKIPTASFFSYVFINRGDLTEEDIGQILVHEHYHAIKLHSLDVLFIEIVKVLWWFSPVVYFYKNSLQEAHEYEVDQAVCRQYDRKNYAGLLLRLNTALSLAPANMFSLHPLKDRVKMLFNSRSRQNRKWMYLLMLPLVLVACEQLGSHRSGSNAKNILTIGADSTSLVIDSTTTLQNIQRAGRELKAKKGIDLVVLQYETNPVGKIVLIELKVKNMTTSYSATWDLRENRRDVDFWKSYRIIVAAATSHDGTSQLYCHSVPRTNHNGNLSPVAMKSVVHGQTLFQTNCASCHNAVQDMTGPALKGVTDRRAKAWIYAFVRNSSALIASGDSSAIHLADKWNQVPMTHFPQLSDHDIDDIFSYVNARSRITQNLGVAVGSRRQNKRD
jgi:mono/diheme cytochrome c family protein